MPTLAELRSLFSRYGGAGNSFTERLNLLQARLLPEGNWKGSKVPTRFTVYADAYGNATVTLPRELETILAGSYQETACSGRPMPVRNDWYEFAPSGPGNVTGSDTTRGFIPLEGRYTTFADWTTPHRLRIKLEQTETSGKIIFRGTLLGEKVYTLDGAEWIEGVALEFTNATVTTSQYFDAPPYQIIKTVTNGRVSLYVVDDDDNETVVGLYDPDETSPNYKRFKVPVCEGWTGEPITAPVPVLQAQFYTKADIQALVGGSAPITVNADGTHDIAPGSEFMQWFQKIIASGGAGAYTHTFTVDTSQALSGAIMRIAVEMAQSPNQTIEIYSNTTGGSPLQVLTGDEDNAGYFILELEFDGTNWVKINGGYLT